MEVAGRDADVGRCRCRRRTDARSGRAARRRRRSRTRVRPRARRPSATRSSKSLRRGAAMPPLRGDLLDERRLVLLQVVEDPAHFLRLHPALVVVEHDVVRLVADLEALDVALAQVEVLAQHGQECLEVVVLARLDPDRVRERGRARHLGAQVGRHLPPSPSRARRRGSGSPRASRTRAARPSRGARRAACRSRAR